MFSDEEYLASGDVSQITESLRTQSLEADGGIDSHTECSKYKLGLCKQEHCTKLHPDVNYPSCSRWEKHHVDRLRFEFVSFGMDCYLSAPHIVIYEWLVSSTSRLTKILDDLNSPDFLEVVSTATCKKIRYDTVTILLEHEVGEHQQDPFLQILATFCQKNNIHDDNKTTLMHNAEAVPACKIEYRLALITWILVIKCPKVSEFLLDDLMVQIIRAAAAHLDTCLIIRVRESTARNIKVCGNVVNVLSNVEVSGLDSQGILQVVTSTENKVLTKECKKVLDTPDVEHFLPQIACEALGIGEDSPFGTDFYKTVYQISLHVVHNKEGIVIDTYALLTRCHMSRNTLNCMSEKQIPNPLKKSVVMYQQIRFDEINKEAIAFLYRATKAVLCLFKDDRNKQV
ncbi:uncharacterized protein LOC144443592 [Glandiceps talaboti]